MPRLGFVNFRLFWSGQRVEVNVGHSSPSIAESGTSREGKYEWKLHALRVRLSRDATAGIYPRMPKLILLTSTRCPGFGAQGVKASPPRGPCGIASICRAKRRRFRLQIRTAVVPHLIFLNAKNIEKASVHSGVPPHSLLHIPHFRIHAHVLAAAFGDFLAGSEIVAPRGALCRGVEVSRPLAERIAEPGLLRLQPGQPEFFPDLPRVLHVLALGQ